MATELFGFTDSEVSVASDPKREGYGNEYNSQNSSISGENLLQVTRKEKGMATFSFVVSFSYIPVASDPKREGYGNCHQEHSYAYQWVASDPKREGYGNGETKTIYKTSSWLQVTRKEKGMATRIKPGERNCPISCK